MTTLRNVRFASQFGCDVRVLALAQLCLGDYFSGFCRFLWTRKANRLLAFAHYFLEPRISDKKFLPTWQG